MQEEVEKIVERITNTGAVDTVELSSGLIAKIKAVSPLLLGEVGKSFPEIPIPKQVVPTEDGEIEEENPLDPTYLSACKKREGLIGMATMRAAVAAGVEVELPEDDSWIKMLEAINPDIRTDTPTQRRISYILYIAATTNQDLTSLAEAVMAKSMATEEAIRAKGDRFRGTVSGHGRAKIVSGNAKR